MAVSRSTSVLSLALVLFTHPVMPPLCVAGQEKKLTVARIVSYAHSQQSDPALDARLTNADVLELVRAGLSADIIIAKIQRSRCNFDTNPTQLAELKSKGVPDQVLRAMIEAPYGQPVIIKAPRSATAPEPTIKPVEDKPKKKTATADLPVYGSSSELRSLRSVYVTSDEPSSRDLVLSVIRKYAALRVVNSPEDAEFILECTVKASTESRGRQPSHYLRTLLTAYTIDEEGRKRILWTENETYEERNGFSFSRPNEVNLARHFVELLKKLRGEK